MKQLEDFVQRGIAAQKAVDETMRMQQYLDLVNQLLKGASPIGAYCLGFSAAIYKQTGKFPPRQTLERLVQCQSVAEGAAIYDQVLAVGKRKRA